MGWAVRSVLLPLDDPEEHARAFPGTRFFPEHPAHEQALDHRGLPESADRHRVIVPFIVGLDRFSARSADMDADGEGGVECAHRGGLRCGAGRSRSRRPAGVEPYLSSRP